MAVSMIQHIAFELLRLVLYAAFVADEIWGDMLEPARNIWQTFPDRLTHGVFSSFIRKY